MITVDFATSVSILDPGKHVNRQTQRKCDSSAKNIALLAKLLPASLRTLKVGILCGSRLGMLQVAESITERVAVPYSVLEGFRESTGACLGTRAPLMQAKSDDLLF